MKEIGLILSDETLTAEEKKARAEQAIVTFYHQVIKVTRHVPKITMSMGFPVIDGVTERGLDELPTPSQPDAPTPSEPDTEEPPSSQSAS